MESLNSLRTISIPKEKLKILRDDPKFLLILRLTRFNNQLLFCIGTFYNNKGANSDFGQCAYVNSFLFASGVLFEALKFAEGNIEEGFVDYQSFKDGFKLLLEDEDTRFLKDNILKPMRNQTVFHVDEIPFKKALKKLNIDTYNFAVRDVSLPSDFYQLTDAIVFNYIFAKDKTKEEASVFIQENLQRLRKVTAMYSESSEKLISEYMAENNDSFEHK